MSIDEFNRICETALIVYIIAKLLKNTQVRLLYVKFRENKKYLQHIVGIFELFLTNRDYVCKDFSVLTLINDEDIDLDSLEGLIERRFGCHEPIEYRRSLYSLRNIKRNMVR